MAGCVLARHDAPGLMNDCRRAFGPLTQLEQKRQHVEDDEPDRD
jgi:hypothetical protein